MNINWSEFNGDKFQKFCNDLLSFEFGKSFIPFAAPGADQGIDGLFEGEYSGKQGKWRFQAKFHAPDTGRIGGINQLRSEIKSDLSNNVTDENNVVFITNVEINPKQRRELINVGIDILSQDSKSVNFDIWDGAKIHTLVAGHPIVKLWYTTQTRHLIQEYSEFFRDELEAKSESNYDFSNMFYYRKDKIAEIDQFLNDPKKKLGLVSGEAGIGKTRLCVEFFKQKLNQNPDWIALVLVTHKIDLQVLQMALTGDKNYILLIDDADKFEEKDIADLITLIKFSTPNKVKLLLTVREHFTDQVISQVSAKDKIEFLEYIKLEKLTREETVNIIEAEIKGYRIEEYISAFANMVQGIPIMIMALLKVLRNGTHPSEIKSDSFLKTYVSEYFEQFAKRLCKEKEIKKRSVQGVIKLLSLIEPIQLNDNNLIQQISETETIEMEEVEIILQAMKEYKIISGNYEFDIKPDTYSDLILQEAVSDPKWLQKKLPNYKSYLGNIIKNISYASQGQHENQILEKLLREYIDSVDECKDHKEILGVLDTMHITAYTIPVLSIEAVKKVISIYSNQNHPLYEEFQESLSYKNYSMDSVLNRIKQVLRSLFQLEGFYHEAYLCSKELYGIIKDEGLASNISYFSRSDMFEGFNCKRQTRIINCIKTVGEEQIILDSFATRTLQELLKLEFNDAVSHPFQPHSLQMYTINVPDKKEVKQLREEIISILVENYGKVELELNDTIFNILLDVPRQILSRKDKKYEGNNELTDIFKFLESISKTELELNQKQTIKERLSLFKRWGVDKSFHPAIERISQNLASKDLNEQLFELFSPDYEERMDRSNEQKEKFDAKSKSYIENHPASELGDAVVKYVEQCEYETTQFYQFLELFKTNLPKAHELVIYLWSKHKGFLLKYGTGTLRSFRFSKEYESEYWKFVDLLKLESTIESRNCLLHVYNCYAINNVLRELKNLTLIDSRDIDLINYAFQNSTEENYNNLTSTLPTIFFFDRQIAVQEIRKFVKKCNGRNYDHLVMTFDVFNDKFYEELRGIVLEDAIHLEIPYQAEEFLGKVIEKEGFQVILDFIERRILYKRNHISKHNSLFGYEYIPKDSGNVMTRSLDLNLRQDIFSKILTWFVEFDFESYETYVLKDVIEFFATENRIDDGAKKVYFELIEKYRSHYEKLLRICDTLSEFEHKEDNIVDLITLIVKYAYENFNNKEEQDELISQCYASLTSVGVKTGTPGQPFSVDLHLKQLLENTLGNNKLINNKVRDFLQRTIASVQKDIDRDSRERDEIW